MSLLADVTAGNAIIRPELGIMLFHDFKKDAIDVTVCFVAGGESFLIDGAQRTRNSYQTEMAVNLDCWTTPFSRSATTHEPASSRLTVSLPEFFKNFNRPEQKRKWNF